LPIFFEEEVAGMPCCPYQTNTGFTKQEQHAKQHHSTQEWCCGHLDLLYLFNRIPPY